MKYIFILKLCVCLSFGVSSFTYADDIKVVMDEDGTDYRAIFWTSAFSSCPIALGLR
jgi:hypothetical protein